MILSTIYPISNLHPVHNHALDALDLDITNIQNLEG
jgi:hypothetical protein